MATINKDTPCLFITTVTRNRLPVLADRRPEGYRSPLQRVTGVQRRVLHAEGELYSPDPAARDRAGLAARAEDYRWSSAR
jgi:hypothetical protein